MLVLTRRPGEQIVIGNSIRVTVVSVGPGRVKIGIEAPSDVRIDRQEIHEKILHEQHEQAIDVLAAVAAHPTTGQHGAETQPLMVASSDTNVKLHNRIADKLPAAEPDADVTTTPAPEAAINRLTKHRLPRKSR